MTEKWLVDTLNNRDSLVSILKTQEFQITVQILRMSARIYESRSKKNNGIWTHPHSDSSGSKLSGTNDNNNKKMGQKWVMVLDYAAGLGTKSTYYSARTGTLEA